MLQVLECGCRTAHVALVAVGDKLKYILATENMKAGDVIKTSRHLPRIPGWYRTSCFVGSYEYSLKWCPQGSNSVLIMAPHVTHLHSFVISVDPSTCY